MIFLHKAPKLEKKPWLISIVCRMSAFLFRLLYHNKIYFVEKPPAGNAILAANHVSFLDPPMIGGTWPQEVHFLAGDYLFRVPLFGRFIAALNSHPVARGSGDLGAFRLMTKLLKEGKKIVVFPEGTRSRTGELTEFKKGVAKLSFLGDAPVIPIYIKGTYEIWGRGRKWPKLSGHTSVYYGKAIYPSEYKDLDKRAAEEALTKDLKQAIVDLKDAAEKLRPR
jgi:1-acyl-sn-glycerol-3-phosphate acyltransferase